MVSPGHRVLDLGTGCGLGALIAASRGATVVACDVSKVAMDAAQRNVDAAGLADSVELRHGCGAEVVGDEVFDLIWCTPPQQPQRAEGEAQRATRAGEGHRDLVPILEAIPRWAGQRGRFVVLCDDDWGLESLIQRHCPEGFRSVQLAETLGALAHHRVLSLGYDLEAARVERHREEGRLRDGSAKAAVSRRRWEANSGSGSAEGGAAPDPEEQPTP